MIKVEYDFAEMEKYAASLGARINQIPFALATALNRSADVTRNFLIKQTWPTHVTQRNASFIAASLTTRQARASKQSLSVEIYDRLDRGHLQMQAKGGTRVGHKGRLAIPTGAVKRTGRGVPAKMKPRNLKTAIEIRGNLFTRDGRGRLKMVYALKQATKIPKRVPFYEDFNASMTRELRRTIPLAVAKAMATARR